MNIRFVTKTLHAYLDYPVAFALLGLPLLLDLGESHPLALWLSVGAGGAAFALTLFTDHKLGVFRLLSYPFHVRVDFLVGIVFLAAPFVLGFSGLDAWYYWLNGAAVVLVTSLQRPEDMSINKTSMA